MSVDLTPEVRIRAARAVESILDEGWQPEFDKDFELRMEREIVDAVAAVVAPQIARPLQARIVELEARNAELLTERLHLSNEAEALEDENLRLRDQAGEMAEELERLRRTSIVDHSYAGQEIKVEFDDE